MEQSQLTASAGEENIASDKSQLEKDVQNTINELREEAASGTYEEITPEAAAALPKGIRAKDVAAQHVPGLLVSVIIPVHNGCGTIRAAIDSVLDQDMHFESAHRIGRGSIQEMEILVIDDASTDDLDAVEKEYEDHPEVIFLHNEHNLGAAKSRNRGVLLARGKYVAFLDADDCWDRGKLKKQFARIYETGDVLCCTGRELMDESGKLTGRVIGVKERLTYRDLLWHNQINCSSVVMLTKVARRYPMAHEDSHEDYITWMQILSEYEEVCAVNEPLLKYRVSNKGKSGSKLRSARMTYKAYRYMGFGPVKSTALFISYAIHGAIKYSRA